MSVITISRQFGSGGKTLGEMISKELGYSFFDDQIIQMIAEKARVSPGWVKSIEKEAGSTILKFITAVGRKSFLERISSEDKGYIDEEVYVELLNKIIFEIANAGNAIILGRSGQYILRDFKGAYHILLVAEREDRIRFMEKNYGFSTSMAVKVITRQEKRRINLYRKFGKEDYDQPGLYHIVLNMSKLSLETACRQVCNLVLS